MSKSTHPERQHRPEERQANSPGDNEGPHSWGGCGGWRGSSPRTQPPPPASLWVTLRPRVSTLDTAILLSKWGRLWASAEDTKVSPTLNFCGFWWSTWLGLVWISSSTSSTGIFPVLMCSPCVDVVSEAASWGLYRQWPRHKMGEV